MPGRRTIFFDELNGINDYLLRHLRDGEEGFNLCPGQTTSRNNGTHATENPTELP